MIGFKTIDDYTFDECVDFINQHNSSHPLWIDINRRYSLLLKQYRQEDNNCFKRCRTKKEYQEYIAKFSNINGALKYKAANLKEALEKIESIKKKKWIPIIVVSTILVVWLVLYIGTRFFLYISHDDWGVANYAETWIGANLGYRDAQFHYAESLEGDEAIDWYKKAAEQGHVDAMYELGYLHESDDQQKAFYWYNRAAQLGDCYAIAKVGDCYRWGKGVEKNEREAYKWYLKVSNNEDFMDKIGDCYYWGIGVKQNYHKAAEWYKKAAAANNHWASYRLGCCYYYGDGVKKDYAKAVEIFNKESEHYKTKYWAKYRLGCCYYYGNGAPVNYEIAEKLFRDASEGGVTPATEMLDSVAAAE